MNQDIFFETSITIQSEDKPDSRVKLNKSNEKNRLVKYELPPQCVPLTHQAAGHFFGSGKRGFDRYCSFILFKKNSILNHLKMKGLLQTKDGNVIKPEQTREKGDEEHKFFKRIFISNYENLFQKPPNHNENEICLRKFLPTYLGEYEHNNGKEKFF